MLIMLIVYDSRTGNVKRFINNLKLNIPMIQVTDGLIVNEPFILVTYTTKIGQTPQTTLDFLKNNHNYLLSVASSGNKNWGQYFAKSADNISQMYHVPILFKFELFGTPNDIENFTNKVIQYETH